MYDRPLFTKEYPLDQFKDENEVRQFIKNSYRQHICLNCGQTTKVELGGVCEKCHMEIPLGFSIFKEQKWRVQLEGSSNTNFYCYFQYSPEDLAAFKRMKINPY